MPESRIHLFQLQDEMPDFFLRVGDKDLFQVQRERIAGSSPKIRNIIYGDSSDARSATVEGINPDIFNLILRYIYGKEIIIQPDNAYQLHEAAVFYQLDELVNRCQSCLQSHVPVTFTRSLTLGKLHYLTRLSDLEKAAIAKAQNASTPKPLKTLPTLPDIVTQTPLTNNVSSEVKPVPQTRKPQQDLFVSDLRDEIKERADTIRIKNEKKKTIHTDRALVKNYTKPGERMAPMVATNYQRNAEEYVRTHKISLEVLDYYRKKFLDDVVEEPKTNASPEEKIISQKGVVTAKPPPPPPSQALKPKPPLNISSKPSLPPTPTPKSPLTTAPKPIRPPKPTDADLGVVKMRRPAKQMGRWVTTKAEQLQSPRNSLVGLTDDSLLGKNSKRAPLRRTVSNVETFQNLSNANTNVKRQSEEKSIIQEELATYHPDPFEVPQISSQVTQMFEQVIGELPKGRNPPLSKASSCESSLISFDEQTEMDETPQRTEPALIMVRDTIAGSDMGENNVIRDRLKVIKNCKLIGLIVSVPVRETSAFQKAGIKVEILRNKEVVSKGQFEGKVLTGNEIIIDVDPVSVVKYDILYFQLTLTEEGSLTVYNKMSGIKEELVPVKGEGVLAKALVQ